MRTEEANTFLQSFHSINARELVYNMMVENYTEAILIHHPKQSHLSQAEIHDKCAALVQHFFANIENIKEQPEELFPLFHQLSRSSKPRSPIWFDEFDEAYTHYKHVRKLKQRLESLRPFFKGTSFCDIGCGGGDLVAYVQNKESMFERVGGIDVLDWRTENLKGTFEFQMLDFSKPETFSEKQYDTMTCLAVLHHVGNTDVSRSIFLKNIHSAVNKSGRLIVEEDVILPKSEIVKNPGVYQQITELSNNQPLYARFLELDYQEQRNVIVLIDFLANCLSVGVPDMTFPCGFKSLQEWISLFQMNGFTVDTIDIKGFVANNFNRSSHVIFVLNKA